MIASLPCLKCFRLLVGALALLCTALLFTGCDLDGYPQELTYPLRSDPLVVGHPQQDAPDLDRPGDFPNVLFANLNEEERTKFLLDPAKLKPEQRQELDKALTRIFGTPALPQVEGGNAEVQAMLQTLSSTLKLDQATLISGAGVYRKQCLHCHGLTGDGRGPTSPWVNPHPRDYRQGVFKFTSSSQGEGERRPRKEDIERTIREGILGTSMPSFRLLPDEEIEALASYVIHLSLRGEAEYLVTSFALKGEIEGDLVEGGNGLGDCLKGIATYWQNAQQSLIPAEAPPTFKNEEEQQQSIQRGFQLFTKQGEAGCISCHTDFGRQAPYKYDYWGTIVRPADITTGVLRGGRRPIDLYYRIHSGINGTGMTAFGKALKPQDIWDLVHFVKAVPYPQMRQKFGVKLESD
ncbi:MAG TPA: cytochrome c [Gemmataceae bacterium]|nr:cytochrome c [Gemmataceae bacterium]